MRLERQESIEGAGGLATFEFLSILSTKALPQRMAISRLTRWSSRITYSEKRIQASRLVEETLVLCITQIDDQTTVSGRGSNTSTECSERKGE